MEKIYIKTVKELKDLFEAPDHMSNRQRRRHEKTRKRKGRP